MLSHKIGCRVFVPATPFGCVLRLTAVWLCATALPPGGRQGYEEGPLMHAGSSETEILRPGSSAPAPKRVGVAPRAAHRSAGDVRHDRAHGAE